MVSNSDNATMVPDRGGNSSDIPSTMTLESLNDAEIRRMIPTVFYLVILSVVGMLGNSLVCHVYHTRYNLANSQCFILCLSAIDLFSCAVAIPLETATIFNQYTFEHLWLCMLSRFLNTLGTLSASFLLVFIAIERYRKVCHPFGWQIKANAVKILCVLSVILGVVLSWPAIFIYGKQSVKIPEYGLTGTECSTDDSMLKTIFPLMHAAAFGGWFIVGTISVCVMYCFIGREAKKHTKNMQKATSDIKSKHKDNTQSDEIVHSTENKKAASDENTQDEIVEQRHNVNICGEIKDRSPRVSKCLETVEEQEGETDGDTNYKEETLNDTNKEDVAGSSENNKMPKLSYTPAEIRFKPQNARSRLSVIGSRIVRRMSSRVSTTNAGPTSFVKAQYLKQARAQKKTTFLMFLISLAFITSYMPVLLLMITRQLGGRFVDNMTDDGRAVYKFFLRSYFFNCAVNPIIYGVCDPRFRTACKEICSRFSHRESHVTSTVTDL